MQIGASCSLCQTLGSLPFYLILLDFLPFVCAGCEKIFWYKNRGSHPFLSRDHRFYDHHQCPKWPDMQHKVISLVCPKCYCPLDPEQGRDIMVLFL
jgi:hypothetical protein